MSEIDGGAERPGGSRPSGVNGDQKLGAFASPAAPLGGIALRAIPWLACLLVLCCAVLSGLAGPMGLWLKYDYLGVPFVLGGIAWVTARLSRSATPALIALVMCSAFLVLFGTWQAGISDGAMTAGLFPYSDAQGYLTDALRLLTGERLSDFSSRRPLFPVFLAGLLGLTGLNLRLVLGIFTALAALAIGLATREVQRSLGPLPGAVFLLCLFLFYRRYIGSTLTEQLGLTFGCVAFALLWRGAGEMGVRRLFWGLLFLSLALNARAGAFLILPAIVLWAGWVYRTRKAPVTGMLAAGVAAVLAGFAINALLLSLVGVPRAAFSNFAYVLYGLVFGGNWTSVLQHHPELARLPLLEQADKIYGLAWEQIRSHPAALMTGCLRAWADFFIGHSGTWASHILNPTPAWSDAVVRLRVEGVAAFLRPEGRWILLEVVTAMLWTICLNVLLATGVIVAGRNRRQPLALLSLLGWGGILLSVPFVPPWDADSMRAYAATLPFIIVLPSLGLLFDAPEAVARAPAAAGNPSPAVGAVLGVGALLLVLQLAVPLAVVRLGGGPRVPARASRAWGPGCARPGEARALLIPPGSAVRLQEPAARPSMDWSGNTVSLQDIRAREHPYEFLDVLSMWRGLARMDGGAVLFSAYDLDRRAALYARSNQSLFRRLPRRAVLCGESVRYGRMEWFRVDGVASSPGEAAPPGSGSPP